MTEKGQPEAARGGLGPGLPRCDPARGGAGEARAPAVAASFSGAVRGVPAELVQLEVLLAWPAHGLLPLAPDAADRVHLVDGQPA